MTNIPSLFGLKHTNRDFTKESGWGKNQFNSSFPAALACYMASKDIDPVYLKLNTDLQVYKDYITTRNLFNIPSDKTYEDVYFEFEGLYRPHDELDNTNLRSDLVIRSLLTEEEEYYSHHEVKLTTLPDSATYNKDERYYGSEIVIRSVSIVHLSANLIEIYKDSKEELIDDLKPITDIINDWRNEDELIEVLPNMIAVLNNILIKNIGKQTPIIMNPVWKTKGKSAEMDENCLDMFVWSDFALTRLFVDSINVNKNSIDRYSRAVVWLLYLLHEFSIRDIIDSSIIYTMPFNHQTDKAFACNGNKTNPYMQGDELLNPRIKREEISNIILGGGQLMLSPERRFDAAIFFSTDIFKEEN